VPSTGTWVAATPQRRHTMPNPTLPEKNLPIPPVIPAVPPVKTAPVEPVVKPVPMGPAKPAEPMKVTPPPPEKKL